MIGMEVGDDRITACRSTLQLAIIHIVQEKVLKMSTSTEDTFISKDLYNLAEVTSIIPRTKSGSFNHARKSGKNFEDLEFLDDAAERVLLDVVKGNEQAHISTSVGKASFLRSRIKSRPEVRQKMQIANFFQDGLLNMSKAPDPKYLPTFMGGIGHPPLFDNELNVFLFVRSFRGGAYQRVYASATREAQSLIENLEITGINQSLVLCAALRMKQEYLHATYADKVAVPRRGILPTALDNPLYQQLGVNAGATAVEQRLMRAKVLVTRTVADIELNRTARTIDIIFGGMPKVYADKLEKISRMERTKDFGQALRANSAFTNLVLRKAIPEDIDKLMQDGWRIIQQGEREFTVNHGRFIANGCKGEVYSADDFTASEDMFLREEVSTEESLKVSGIPLNVKLRGQYRERFTTSKIGLYEISKTQQEWAENLSTLLKSEAEHMRPIPPYIVREIFFDNREWVNDDSQIVAYITKVAMEKNLNHTDSICIVTTDEKLCRRAAHSANIIISKIEPVSYALRCRTLGINPQNPEERHKFRIIDEITSSKCFPSYAHRPKDIVIDTGSLAAHLSKLEEVQSGKAHSRPKIGKKAIINVGTNDKGRFERYSIKIRTSQEISSRGITPDLNKMKRYKSSSGSSSYRKAHSSSSASADSYSKSEAFGSY